MMHKIGRIISSVLLGCLLLLPNVYAGPEPIVKQDVQPGIYQISNVKSDLCMDVKGESVDRGAPVLQWHCRNQDNQLWRIAPAGNGSYYLFAIHSGQVLDVPRSSTEEGTGIIQWPLKSRDNQRWKIIPVDDGIYEIRNVNSDLCLDVRFGTSEAGGRIQQYGCHGGDNQLWRLESDDYLSFIVTAVNDGLDNTDLYDMAHELMALGYTEAITDTDVTTSDLSSYLQREITTLYHTGHGDVGLIATANGEELETQDLMPNKINVQNTIIATCLTVKNESWRNTFGPGAKTLAGYTNFSWDFTDEDVVKDFGDYLANGRSYQMAWYLANNNQNSLLDRWLIYVRQGNMIVEYSARSGNRPENNSIELKAIDQAGKVEVAEQLLNNHHDYSQAFGRLRMLPADKTSSVELTDFQKLVLTAIPRNDAVKKSNTHLKALGELSDDMSLSRSYAIQSRKYDNTPWDNVGWVTRYTMTAKDGLQIRGNGCEPNKSIMVTGTGTVVAMSKYWPQILVEKDAVTHLGLLTPSQALDKAKEEISRRIKKGPLGIIDVEPVYGVSKPAGEEQLLVPSYGFSTNDNFVIVVNAITGELLL